MDSSSPSQIFLKQLMLIRYAGLLEKIKQTYPLSPNQMELLESQILTIEWLGEIEL